MTAVQVRLDQLPALVVVVEAQILERLVILAAVAAAGVLAGVLVLEQLGKAILVATQMGQDMEAVAEQALQDNQHF